MTETVRVLHSSHGAANSIMALGVATGCFLEAGLNVVMEEVARTGLAVSMLMDGAAEFAVAGSAPVIAAALAGHDPLIVMNIEALNVFGVIGAKGIETPEMLRGRRIAISGRREQDETMMRRALLEWSIDPDRDVQLEIMGSRGKCWDAVVSGHAAAMTATIPQPLLARAVGLPVLKDYGAQPEPFQLGALVTSRRYARQHPGTVRRMIAGQLRSLRLYQRDVEAALPHLRARAKITDPEVLRETHRQFSHAAEDYIPNVAALAAVIKSFEMVYGEAVPVDAAAFVDPSFAASVNEDAALTG